MKSTKFHTADENSLGRFVSINKSVRPYTPIVSRNKGRCRWILSRIGLETGKIERDSVWFREEGRGGNLCLLQGEKGFSSFTECWEFQCTALGCRHDIDYSRRENRRTTGNSDNEEPENNDMPFDVR